MQGMGASCPQDEWRGQDACACPPHHHHHHHHHHTHTPAHTHTHTHTHTPRARTCKVAGTPSCVRCMCAWGAGEPTVGTSTHQSGGFGPRSRAMQEAGKDDGAAAGLLVCAREPGGGKRAVGENLDRGRVVREVGRDHIPAHAHRSAPNRTPYTFAGQRDRQRLRENYRQTDRDGDGDRRQGARWCWPCGPPTHATCTWHNTPPQTVKGERTPRTSHRPRRAPRRRTRGWRRPPVRLAAAAAGAGPRLRGARAT